MNDILDDFDPPPLTREWRNHSAVQRRSASLGLKAKHAADRLQWLKNNPKVGDWTIIGLAPFKGKRAAVECICACGAKHTVLLASIKSGNSTKCVKCARKAQQQT